MNSNTEEEWQLHCHNTIQRFKKHHLLLKEQRPRTQLISLDILQQIQQKTPPDTTKRCSQKKRKRNTKKTS